MCSGWGSGGARLFFFSSRRRHTRSKRDWSSDVCSSDLLMVFLSTVLPVKICRVLNILCGVFYSLVMLTCSAFSSQSLLENGSVGDGVMLLLELVRGQVGQDRKSTRLNSSHVSISYAVFC